MTTEPTINSDPPTERPRPCCSPEALVRCCEPSEKGECCGDAAGDAPAPERCGCR